MDDLDFTEEEIEQQLAVLGYSNIPRPRLHEFRRDLVQLIQHERSKSQSSSERETPRSHSSAPRRSPLCVSQAERNYSNVAFTRENLLQTEKRVPFSAFAMDDRNTNYSAVREQNDPYAQHSVAARFPRPATAPYRLDIENIPEDSSNVVSDTSRSTSPDRLPGVCGKPAIKRKVLRKQKGQSHVCDESTHSEADSEAVGRLEERLDRLQMGPREPDLELDSEDRSILSDRSNSDAGRGSSAFQVYTSDTLRSESESDVRSRPKSFIRPQMDHPHTRNLKKTDPVSKYFQYKQDWENFKAPGERERKGLRWGIREQMLYKSQLPPKPQRVYIPNTYVVPTEKKRLALRWEVRHDLANGVLPPKMFYPL
ncbi:centriolar and ciliogenesis-associated protein HYSL1 isoform X3 [Amia ocellicauda]|uniref:centriolar and ciliogenesis-associated protein HYSL1 isoform X3 n=1 Tax=Amia ocellicauda TaxID=2972642 RepID=UPI003463CB7A